MTGIHLYLLFLLGQLLNPTIQGPDRVNINETETISCNATTEARLIMYSLFREMTLIQTKNVSTPDVANFSVSFRSESDAGAYKCKAYGGDGTGAKYSESIKIAVLAPVLGVTTKSTPYPPVLKVQSKLSLSCFVKQGSNVTFQWYFDNQQLLPSPSVKINQSSLVIDHVNLNNTGSYECEVSNQFNMKTFRITSNPTQVTVKVPASNPEISATITLMDKEKMFTVFSCLSREGTLPITYTLYRNETIVSSYIAHGRREGQLLVPGKYSDKLYNFKCKAVNGFQPKYSNAINIDLAVKMTSDPDPPIPGHQFTLNCSVSYEHSGPYTWHFVHPGKNSTQNTTGNQLTVAKTEAGRYYCSVNKQTSNWIEVPGQDSSLQPVTIAVSITATVLLVLTIGLICYCVANKAHRFNVS
ncbi:Fc receptor-like protein 5 isoform X2 [Scyliorhinus canicula]|uniref:Fc receptor-like protein 5 isoform X2 n=1 Tax=Scyliorhinus canicula TaxID=7830 RepID=UPI0018F410E8|nr:Fc receptor-like protein 5 isoform X2 [Scyliorhinus canicula]